MFAVEHVLLPACSVEPRVWLLLRCFGARLGIDARLPYDLRSWQQPLLHRVTSYQQRRSVNSRFDVYPVPKSNYFNFRWK